MGVWVWVWMARMLRICEGLMMSWRNRRSEPKWTAGSVSIAEVRGACGRHEPRTDASKQERRVPWSLIKGGKSSQV